MMEEKMTIVSQRPLTDTIYEMVLTGELVTECQTPGQFLHIRVPRADLLLRRPISIAHINHDKNEVTIIYRVTGAGTEVFSHMKAGESLSVMGPLGHGFPICQTKKALVIGGGVGIPPLYELSCQLQKAGVEVTALLGFRNKEDSFYIEQFEQVATVHVATDDGSLGHHGYVHDLFNEQEDMTVYACGPNPMLKEVAAYYEDYPLYLSLEERMACGVGACYGCVVQDKKRPDHQYKVCHKGPVFKGEDVVL